MTQKFQQCFKLIVFYYFNEQCPSYLNGVADVTTENSFQLRSSFQKKKKKMFWKTNNGQYALSYIGPTFWNQTLTHSNVVTDLIRSNIILKNIS